MASYAIVSASLSHLDSYANHNRTCELQFALLNSGFSPVGTIAVINGQRSSCFIVPCYNPKKVVDLARKFGQKSILFSEMNEVSLIPVKDDQNWKFYGKMRKLAKHELEHLSMYLAVFEDNRTEYFSPCKFCLAL